MATRKRSAKKAAARPKTKGTLLEHLKPQEAAEVLRRLLVAHVDFRDEAERIANVVLAEVTFEDTAVAVEDAVAGVDIDDVYARAGKHEWGYVEPGEAASHILDSAVEPFIEDLKRQIDIGLETEALETCKGIVLGLYRFAEESEHDVLQWAPEFPSEAAGYAIDVWLGDRNGRGKRPKRRASRNRPGFPPDFVHQLVPQWADMISRILRAKYK